MEEHDHVREIYAASAGRLVSQIYAMTGDFAEAQDAVQDAFARAVARPGKFAGTWSTFICGTTTATAATARSG